MGAPAIGTSSAATPTNPVTVPGATALRPAVRPGHRSATQNPAPGHQAGQVGGNGQLGHRCSRSARHLCPQTPPRPRSGCLGVELFWGENVLDLPPPGGQALLMVVAQVGVEGGVV